MFDATHMHHGSDGLSTVSCMSAIALPDLWRVSCDDRATAVRHARVAFVLFLFLPEVVLQTLTNLLHLNDKKRIETLWAGAWALPGGEQR